MTIYFPESVLELPLIKKASEMLNLHAEEYEEPNIDLKETIILDPVKNFLSLYIDYEDDIDYFAQLFYSVKGTKKVIQFLYQFGFLNDDCTIIYKSSRKLSIRLEGIVTKFDMYYPQNSVESIVGLRKRNESERSWTEIENPTSTPVEVDSLPSVSNYNLGDEVLYNGTYYTLIETNYIIDYCSEEYINRFREFLKALLYFHYLDIQLKNLVITFDLNYDGGVFVDTDLFVIEKKNE